MVTSDRQKTRWWRMPNSRLQKWYDEWVTSQWVYSLLRGDMIYNMLRNCVMQRLKSYESECHYIYYIPMTKTPSSTDFSIVFVFCKYNHIKLVNCYTFQNEAPRSEQPLVWLCSNVSWNVLNMAENDLFFNLDVVYVLFINYSNLFACSTGFCISVITFCLNAKMNN